MTIDFDSIDFSSIEEGDFSVGKPLTTTEKLNFIGGSKQNWPIDVRIIVNMVNKDEAKPYHESHFHEYVENDQYLRIPCSRSVGQTCPICDAHWDHKGNADKLAARGAGVSGHEDHAEFQKQTILAKKFEQKKRFSMLAVVRGDTKVSILESKPQLTKAIFGDKFKGTAGAIAELKSYGVPVFSPTEPTGWLTLSKSGQGLTTTYTAKPAAVIKTVGKKREEQLIEEELHPMVVEKFKDMTKLPALYKRNFENQWSSEELENYVLSGGTQLPGRVVENLAKWSKKKGPEASSTSQSSASNVPDLGADDFNPF